jgi:hypothetical protein
MGVFCATKITVMDLRVSLIQIIMSFTHPRHVEASLYSVYILRKYSLLNIGKLSTGKQVKISATAKIAYLKLSP